MTHRFGGAWTAAKLSALQEYLNSYATALKGKPFSLHYLDAFAGSGSYVPNSGVHSHDRKGSAQIALGIAGFDHYVFIEKREARCKELREICDRSPSKRCFVLWGDANEHLTAHCRRVNWRAARAVLFLDPYGLHASWSTLEAVAATEAIDVWYLFPLNGVTRQLAHDVTKVDANKSAALDRVLGTREWRDAFYQRPATGDLFGNEADDERHADHKSIMDWITARLRTIFPAVLEPVVLRKSREGNPASGPPLFALYFLVASKQPRAQEVAMRIAQGVIKKLVRDGVVSASR